MTVDNPQAVTSALREMGQAGGRAFLAATEDGGLNGPLRDLIFALNTAVDAVVDMVAPE
jgi:hypothetical protein